MTQREFEERTHRATTAEEYTRIETFYMLDDNLDKDTFCANYREGKERYLADLAMEAVLRFKKQADENGAKAKFLGNVLKAIRMSIPSDEILKK